MDAQKTEQPQPKRGRGRPRKHPPKVKFTRPKVKPPGKPSKLTPELGASICDYIRQGSWLEIAAAANGIHRGTLHRWLKKGSAYLKAIRKGVKPKDSRHKIYADFVEQVHVANAQGEVKDVKRIDGFANTVWQAAAWKLDRKARDRKGLIVTPGGFKTGDTSFSQKTTQEITHTDNREPPGKNVDALNMPLEVKQQLLAAMRAYKLAKQQTTTIDAQQPPREITHDAQDEDTTSD